MAICDVAHVAVVVSADQFALGVAAAQALMLGGGSLRPAPLAASRRSLRAGGGSVRPAPGGVAARRSSRRSSRL
eukprot:8210823-Heterocapsa_arctica.AAC.1